MHTFPDLRTVPVIRGLDVIFTASFSTLTPARSSMQRHMVPMTHDLISKQMMSGAPLHADRARGQLARGGVRQPTLPSTGELLDSDDEQATQKAEVMIPAMEARRVIIKVLLAYGQADILRHASMVAFSKPPYSYTYFSSTPRSEAKLADTYDP